MIINNKSFPKVFRHQFEDEQKPNRRNSLWYLAVNYVCKFVPNIENKQRKQNNTKKTPITKLLFRHAFLQQTTEKAISKFMFSIRLVFCSLNISFK